MLHESEQMRAAGDALISETESLKEQIDRDRSAIMVESRAADAEHAFGRLSDQLAWYDAKAAHNRAWFHRLKVAQIVLAALIPVAAGANASGWITGSLGALIVVLEGLQQLFQYQQNWTSYRSTAEALKHEKHLYLARAGPYADAPQVSVELAERVEGLVSQEHAAWSSARKQAAAPEGARAATP